MEANEKIEYDDRTKQLMEMRGEAERQFDRQIVYLSSGGLIFSVGFVKDIIGDNSEPVYKWLLIVVWISFAISLIINLISYLTSRRSIDNELLGREKVSNKFNSCTVWLNWISLFALLNGLLFLLLFASANF
jgi:hypothetical protein